MPRLAPKLRLSRGIKLIIQPVVPVPIRIVGQVRLFIAYGVVAQVDFGGRFITELVSGHQHGGDGLLPTPAPRLNNGRILQHIILAQSQDHFAHRPERIGMEEFVNGIVLRVCR